VITVYELVAQILKLRLEDVTDETGAATTAAWTSMRHVQLVVAIEKCYGVRLAPREARSVRSVAHVKQVLATHGVQT
jgi:acyl carrier protein